MEDLNWQIIENATVFSTQWFSITKNKAVLPGNIQIDDYYVVKNHDAVMILAFDEKNEIILKREHRLPVDEILIELPAGAIESSDESVINAAKRELREETGYVSDNWTYFGATYDCPERCTAVLHLFLAQNAKKICEQQLDNTEVINCFTVPLVNAVEMCKDGRIKVNSCIHAIYKYVLMNQV